MCGASRPDRRAVTDLNDLLRLFDLPTVEHINETSSSLLIGLYECLSGTRLPIKDRKDKSSAAKLRNLQLLLQTISHKVHNADLSCINAEHVCQGDVRANRKLVEVILGLGRILRLNHPNCLIDPSVAQSSEISTVSIDESDINEGHNVSDQILEDSRDTSQNRSEVNASKDNLRPRQKSVGLCKSIETRFPSGIKHTSTQRATKPIVKTREKTEGVVEHTDVHCLRRKHTGRLDNLVSHLSPSCDHLTPRAYHTKKFRLARPSSARCHKHRNISPTGVDHTADSGTEADNACPALHLTPVAPKIGTPYGSADHSLTFLTDSPLERQTPSPRKSRPRQVIVVDSPYTKYLKARREVIASGIRRHLPDTPIRGGGERASGWPVYQRQYPSPLPRREAPSLRGSHQSPRKDRGGQEVVYGQKRFPLVQVQHSSPLRHAQFNHGSLGHRHSTRERSILRSAAQGHAPCNRSHPFMSSVVSLTDSDKSFYEED